MEFCLLQEIETVKYATKIQKGRKITRNSVQLHSSRSVNLLIEIHSSGFPLSCLWNKFQDFSGAFQDPQNVLISNEHQRIIPYMYMNLNGMVNIVLMLQLVILRI